MDLLEIRLDIGSRLDICGLASCAQVCKLWFETFMPLLYKDCYASVYSSSWPSFQNRLHYVQDLQVFNLDDTLEYDRIMTHCRSLKSLRFLIPHNTTFDLTQFLGQNPLLRKLKLVNEDGLFKPDPKLLETLVQNNRQLKVLDLHGFRLEGEFMRRFLDLGSRLTSLTLKDCWPPLRTALPSSMKGQENLGRQQWQELACIRPKFPQLQDLNISGHPGAMPWKVQFWLFEEAPRLESIYWDLVVDGAHPLIWEFYEALCATFKKPVSTEMDANYTTLSQGYGNLDASLCCWPRLKSIGIGGICRYNVRLFADAFFAELLMSCPNTLRGLTVPKVDLGPWSWQLLGRRHFETLQVLHLPAVSWMIQVILSSCPGLREFWSTEPLDAVDVVDGSKAAEMREAAILSREPERWTIPQSPSQQQQGATQDSLTSEETESEVPWPRPTSKPRPWVCQGLRILRIDLKRMTTYVVGGQEQEERTEEEEEDDEGNRQVFERLTQLKELEELTLCAPQSQRTIGFDPKKYPRYLGLEIDPTEVSTEGISFRSNLQDVRQIQCYLPIGPRLLKTWPKLRMCCLSR
ncbi:hypothetical protein BGZ83_009412 [Gryganskiella cystojenkinii]|nr:hypothetical protein BGZ83_009412 [Gryganskiella cystojenkinii]